MFACIHGRSADLPQIAAAFTPWFEQTAPDTIVFSIAALKRLYGTPDRIGHAIAERAGAHINIAIAETADAAVLAARNFSGLTIAPDLNDINVATLPLPDGLEGTLEMWGIHTLGQLARLPETGIAERFGPEGVHLQRLAKGILNRPLRIAQPEITYEDRVEVDHPVSLLEPLLFLIARILNDQCAKLVSNAMATNEVTIRLELENKTEHVRILRLPVAMRESRALLKLLQMDLEAHPPESATLALSLSLKPVPPRTVQAGIFLPATPAPDKLELTLARIRGLVGENNVGIPELLNTHHPHPFRLLNARPKMEAQERPAATRQAFRYFRPPLPAIVDMAGGHPVRVSASGIQGEVLNAAGPWRTSGHWWTSEPWSRDEWDVALSNSALYRIYNEPARGWFIDGSYD